LTIRRNKWLVFSVVAVGVFMSTLDSSMVNIALPAIMAHFHSSLQLTEWVVMIYLLTITSTLLLWGRLGDMLGRGKLYALGMLIFALASLACALAPNLAVLIVARLLQALGAALMMAIGPALITEAFPVRQLGRAFGLIGMAVSLGLMTGPGLGGMLLELGSWRNLFLITVPVGALFTGLALLVLPLTRNGKRDGPFDWRGGLYMTIGLTLFALTVNHGTAPTWRPAVLIPTAAAWGLVTLLFVRAEATAPAPLLPVRLLREPYFIVGVLSAVLSFMILFTAIILPPFYMVRILGLSSARIGLVMMAVPLAVLVVAPMAGWLSDHIGARWLTTTGILVSTSGLLLLAGLSPTSPPLGVALRLSLLGIGQAMFLSPNSAAVLGRVGNHHIGISGALLATGRNLGMLLGTAQAFLVFSLTFGRLTNGLDLKDFTPAQVEPFMAALRAAYLTAAAIGLVGATLSWLRGPDNQHKERQGCD